MNLHSQNLLSCAKILTINRKMLSELKKIKINEQIFKYTVVENHLDWILKFPWSNKSKN